MAWETGAMAEISHENAITCYLLDAIETTYFKRTKSLKTRPYHSAFLALLQGIAETDGSFPFESLIGYSMLEAITAFSNSAIPGLTQIAEDSLSDQGRSNPLKEPLEDFALRLELMDPDRMDVSQMGIALRGFVDQTKFVARHYSSKVLSRAPLTEDLFSFCSAVEQLCTASDALDKRLQARTDLVRALMCPKYTPNDHPIDDIMQVLRTNLKLPIACLILPVYENCCSISVFAPSSPPEEEDSLGLQCRLSILAERTLKMLLTSLKLIPTMSYVASLPTLHLDRWAAIMLRLIHRPQSTLTAKDIEDMLSFLTIYAFSLPIEDHLFNQLRSELDWRKLQDSILMPVSPPAFSPLAIEPFASFLNIGANTIQFGSAVNSEVW